MAHFMHFMLSALDKYSTRPLIKALSGTPESPSWETITHSAFRDEIERFATYWLHTLTSAGVERTSVVGLWVTGSSYRDLINIYALVRAGFVPQVFSLLMSPQGPPVIKDLLAATRGKALIYDPSFGDILKGFSLPTFAIPHSKSIPTLSDPLPDLPVVEPTDIAMIFHTSGTTSGKPKPVPETHRWFKSHVQVQWPGIWQAEFKTQPMFNNIGSFGNVGSATTVALLSWSGQCLIQTSKPDFDAPELIAMVKEGLNTLLLYAPWLSKLVKIARTDSEVLEALRGMGQITYTGAAMNPEDELWMVEQGIPVANLYATTETALCMISDLSDKTTLPLMRLIPGMKCKLIPTSGLDKTDLDGNSVERFQGGQLYDLFVPEEADNCPHPWVRNRPNGHITGDLFEEVKPGYYAYRGRNDDWIRTGKHLIFCDTKSIEDHVMLVCTDLVQNCVVVGHYKPAIVLFVEPIAPWDIKTSFNALKDEIMSRIADFNSRLFFHERITVSAQIAVLKPGSLPRTKEKGNIRRKAAEEDYKELLEEIYSQLGPNYR